MTKTSVLKPEVRLYMLTRKQKEWLNTRGGRDEECVLYENDKPFIIMYCPADKYRPYNFRKVFIPT